MNRQEALTVGMVNELARRAMLLDPKMATLKVGGKDYYIWVGDELGGRVYVDDICGVENLNALWGHIDIGSGHHIRAVGDEDV